MHRFRATLLMFLTLGLLLNGCGLPGQDGGNSGADHCDCLANPAGQPRFRADFGGRHSRAAAKQRRPAKRRSARWPASTAVPAGSGADRGGRQPE